MIIEKQPTSIERSGEFTSSRSKIVANAHLKKILRSGIYTDKVLAVIRETISNAYDSHVQAGHPERPIQIHVPNLLEPTFKVKDFGVGLDDYGVREILFSYGDPTNENVKTKTNDMHGMYHIGAKAPWAYTNIFTVIAIKDGVKRTYNAFIDEQEDDCIEQVDSTETTEENGVEFHIPVQPHDVNTFVSKLKDFLRFWEPFPIIKGAQSEAMKTPLTWKFKDSNWGYIEDRYRTQSYIVTSGVPYKINHLSISDRVKDDLEATANCRMLQHNLVIFAKIGDVDLSSGREEVAYTDKTTKFIKNTLATLKIEAAKSIETRTKNLSSLYEAKKLYYEIKYEALGDALFNIIKHDYQVRYNHNVIHDIHFANKEFKKLDGNNLIRDAYSFMYRYASSGGKISRYVCDHIALLDSHDKVTYFFLLQDITKDTEFKIKSKIRSFLRKNHTYGHQYSIIEFANLADKEEYLKQTGIPAESFKDYATLPDVPKAKRTPVHREVYNAKVYKPDGFVTKKDIDFDAESGFYIFYKHGNAYLDMKSMKDSLNSLRFNFSWIKLAGLEQVVTITDVNYKKIKDNPNWKPFTSCLKSKILEALEKNKANTTFSFDVLTNEYNRSQIENFFNLIKDLNIKVSNRKEFNRINEFMKIRDAQPTFINIDSQILKYFKITESYGYNKYSERRLEKANFITQYVKYLDTSYPLVYSCFRDATPENEDYEDIKLYTKVKTKLLIENEKKAKKSQKQTLT